MKAHISELIKIAYEHDELRNDLVPLIQSELKVARRGRGRARKRRNTDSAKARERMQAEADRLRQQEGDYSSEGNVWSDINQNSTLPVMMTNVATLLVIHTSLCFKISRLQLGITLL